MKASGVTVTTRLREWASKQHPAIVDMMVKMHESNIHVIRNAPMSEAAKAGVIHGEADKAIAATFKEVPDLAAKVSCKTGCTHCCYLEVGVTVGEAEVMLSYAKEQGLAIDVSRLEAQKLATAEGRFIRLEKPLRKCVFLGEDNLCKVYEFRPVACRKYFVLTPPEDCDTEGRPDKQVASFFGLDAEIIQSAAFQASPSGQMAEMLLKTMNVTSEET